MISEEKLLLEFSAQSRLRNLDADELMQYFNASASELFFWHRFFADQGGEWKSTFKAMVSGSLAPPEWIRQRVSLRPTMQCADIGSGPISILEGFIATGELSGYQAIDPLAHAYMSLVRRSTPTRVVWGLAEFMPSIAGGSLDLAVSRNALDHAFDPVRSLIHILSKMKTDGLIVLANIENEAEREAYEGMHYWNFVEDSGQLIFWNPDYSVNVSEALHGVISVECDTRLEEDGRRWVYSTIRPLVNVEAGGPQRHVFVERALEALAGTKALEELRVFRVLTPRRNLLSLESRVNWRRKIAGRLHRMLP